MSRASSTSRANYELWDLSLVNLLIEECFSKSNFRSFYFHQIILGHIQFFFSHLLVSHGYCHRARVSFLVVRTVLVCSHVSYRSTSTTLQLNERKINVLLRKWIIKDYIRFIAFWNSILQHQGQLCKDAPPIVELPGKRPYVQENWKWVTHSPLEKLQVSQASGHRLDKLANGVWCFTSVFHTLTWKCRSMWLENAKMENGPQELKNTY